VDPVSHVILGRAVVGALDRIDGSRFGPGVGAAAIAGALAPDIDFVLMPVGWDVYLRFHQAGTHSPVGACVLGGVVALIVRALRPSARLSGLAAAASLAAISHLLLDFLSGARVSASSLVLASRVSLPLVAMADPWLIGLLAAGAIGMWTMRAHPRRTGRLVLLAVAVFMAAKGILYGRALAASNAGPHQDGSAPRALEATWGSLSQWNVFERGHDALRVWRASGITGALVPVLRWPTADPTPRIEASRSLDTVQNFLSAHNLAFAVERQQTARRVEVLWSDVRYCRQDRRDSGRIDCSLWFGGLFDEGGRALTQVVYLGRWIQSRPPSP